MDKICCIYYFLDENKKPFYVGLTKNLNQRIRNHLFDMRNRNRLPSIRKANKLIRKFGLDFKKDIIKCIEICTEAELENREIFHIDSLKTKGFKLTNLTDGGRGSYGFTEKIHKKSAKSRIGKKLSAETRKRISDALKGKKKSKEHRKSLCLARRIRAPHSVETRKKMSASATGNINIKKFKLIDPNGQIFFTENGLTEFCKSRGLVAQNFHHVLSGKRKHQKGWKIEKLD